MSDDMVAAIERAQETPDRVRISLAGTNFAVYLNCTGGMQYRKSLQKLKNQVRRNAKGLWKARGVA